MVNKAFQRHAIYTVTSGKVNVAKDEWVQGNYLLGGN